MNKIQYVLLTCLLYTFTFTVQVEAISSPEEDSVFLGTEKIEKNARLREDIFHEKLKELELQPWHIFMGVVAFLLFDIILCLAYSGYKKIHRRNLAKLKGKLMDDSSESENETPTVPETIYFSVRGNRPFRPLLLRSYSTFE